MNDSINSRYFIWTGMKPMFSKHLRFYLSDKCKVQVRLVSQGLCDVIHSVSVIVQELLGAVRAKFELKFFEVTA